MVTKGVAVAVVGDLPPLVYRSRLEDKERMAKAEGDRFICLWVGGSTG